MESFCHLHNHTAYSVLDGQATIVDYLSAVIEDGQPAFAVTDHGSLGGAIELYRLAKERQVQPIVGCELFVDPKEVSDYPHHLTVLAMDEQGYRDLIRANNIAQRQFHYRPRIALRQLIDDGLMKHWVVLSGCFTSTISRAILAEDPRAISAVKMLAQHAGAFYLELMWHSATGEFAEKQNILLTVLRSLGRELGLPLVLTNDCHYVTKEREQIHQSFLKERKTGGKGISFDASGFYLKSSAIMHQIAQKIGAPKAADNTLEIARLCQGLRIPELERRVWHVPWSENPTAQIESLCSAFLSQELAPEYHSRYQRELEVLSSALTIAQSYLIAQDVVSWCHRQGIVAAGRGSMAGSLISYILGITTEDPIKHRLLFERAVSPARPTIPDFDLDVSSHRRPEVLAYIQSKYPYSQPIVTYGRYGPRGAARSVLRSLGWPNPQVNDACQYIDEDWEAANFEGIPAEIRPVIEGMKGTYFNMSVHPAGIALADERRPLEHEVPLAWVASSQQLVTQYDMYTLKELGFFKLDVLGLNALDQLEQMRSVSGAEAPTEYDDLEVLKVFQRGDTTEIFQLDGWAARRVLEQIPAKRFEDLVAVNALKLPGASAFTEQYRDGSAELTDAYPEIAEILEPTRGIVLYQEQVMEICRQLANFNDAEQDDIKEAIKHFQMNVFDGLEERFRSACPHDHALIWQTIKGFAGYAFNKAHAVTYAALAYKMAWYKCYHPLAFYAAVFDECVDTARLLLESQRYGVAWRVADINNSEMRTLAKDGAVCIGLGRLKGIGPATALSIVARRPIQKIEDLSEKREGSRALSQKQREMLQQAGALSSLGIAGDKAVMDDLYDFNTGLLDPELARIVDEKQSGCISGWLFDVSQRQVLSGRNAGQHMGYASVGNVRGNHRIVLFPELWRQFCKEVQGGPAIRFRGRYFEGGNGRDRSFVAENFEVLIK